MQVVGVEEETGTAAEAEAEEQTVTAAVVRLLLPVPRELLMLRTPVLS